MWRAISEKYGGPAYSVVHLSKQNEVSTVPSSWIVGDHVSLPPYQSSTRMITAIKDKEEPSEGWTSYQCTVLFNCADYDDARLKEQRATEMCDIDSDDGCYEPKKRRAQQRTSSNEESVCASDTESGTAVPGPPPPKFRKTAPSKGTTIPLQPDASTMQPLPTASVQAILKVQEETLKLLKETKAQLDTLANAVQELKNSGRPEQTSGDTVDSGMLDLLPLDTHRDLEKLEQYLRIPKNKTDLVAYFSRLGGPSVLKAARRLMRRCMRDVLARDFSLTRRKGKRPFNDLQLLQVATEALQKAFTTATEADVHGGIANWLRYAPSREKKRESHPCFDYDSSS
ncbi:uncharacterized protein LOC142557296 isoform X2 [Dermacentor variabilis]|uniref:uncharacterized protein LOC142557296 isoform X1 n=2 Tax=Dermacentor variabilis TaxID=34621 RepID=UPI003F5B9491